MFGSEHACVSATVSLIWFQPFKELFVQAIDLLLETGLLRRRQLGQCIEVHHVERGARCHKSQVFGGSLCHRRDLYQLGQDSGFVTLG
jgi:hypothetical protein